VTGSLPGLLLFDLVLLVAGWAVLAALRPGRPLASIGASAGLAFWLGLGAEGVLMTWISTFGPGPTVPIVLGIAAALVLVAVVRRLRWQGAAERSSRNPLSALAALGYGLVGMACAGQLLVAWNRPLDEWDGWAFWIPRARLLFDAGHLHADTYTQFSGTTYPPLVPLIHGAAFGFMGASDAVTLHLQAGLFFVAFVHAVARLSRTVASDLYVLPFVLVLATIPEVLVRSQQLDGDYPTEFAFVIGTLLCVLFVRSGARWQLGAAAVLLAAAANSRREGVLYALAVLVAAIVVVTVRRRWRDVWLAAPAVFAGLSAVPWLVWVRWHHVQADSVVPSGSVGSTLEVTGEASLGHAVWVLLTYLFDFRLWSIAPYLGLLVLVAFVFARRRSAPIAGFLAAVLVVTGVAMLWRLRWYGGALNPKGTPIPRIAGMWSLLLCSVAPLLCAATLPDRPSLAFARRLGRWRNEIVVVPLLVVLPAAILVAVASPHLEARVVGCRVAPTVTGPDTVVFGYEPTYADAASLRRRVAKVGFVGSTIDFDGCGRLRVVQPVPSLKVAHQIQAEARTADLPTVVQGVSPA
jgi:hypothetical protein